MRRKRVGPRINMDEREAGLENRLTTVDHRYGDICWDICFSPIMVSSVFNTTSPS